MLLVPVRIDKGMSLIQMVKEYCTSKYHWKEVAKINNLTAPYKIYDGDIIRIPFELLKKRKVQAKVASVIGDVFSVKGPGDTLDPVEKGDRIRPGETLLTGKGGFAIIALPENRYIHVSSNSQFAFTYLFRLVDDSLKVEFFLEKGDVSIDVQKKLRKNETFRARTPFCITGVRGTFYRVKMEEDISIIETLEGKVILSAAESEVTIKEGMGSFIKGNAPPSAPQSLPDPPAVPELQKIYRHLPLHLPAPAIAAGGHGRLRLCMDKAGEQTVWRGDAADGGFLVDKLADGVYYAFYTAVNRDRLEGKPSAPVSFIVRTVPASPILSLQYDGTPVFGNSLKIGWGKEDGVARYQVQVAADEDFTSLLAVKEVGEAGCLFTDMAAGTYYFRVRAVASDGFYSDFSRAGKVILKGVPDLDFIAPHALGEDMILRWSEVGEDISYYDVEIAKDSGFSEVIERGTQLQHGEYQLKSLKPGKHWVRVRAVLPTGEASAWTSAQELMIPAPRFNLFEGVLLGGFFMMLLL